MYNIYIYTYYVYLLSFLAQGTSFKEDETHTLCHSLRRVAIPQGEVESSNHRFAGQPKFWHRISICLKAHLPGQFPHRQQSKRRLLAEPRIATKIDLYTALPTGGRSRSEWKQSADSNVAASIGEGSEGCHAFPNHSRLTWADPVSAGDATYDSVNFKRPADDHVTTCHQK